MANNIKLYDKKILFKLKKTDFDYLRESAESRCTTVSAILRELINKLKDGK